MKDFISKLSQIKNLRDYYSGKINKKEYLRRKIIIYLTGIPIFIILFIGFYIFHLGLYFLLIGFVVWSVFAILISIYANQE